MLYRIKQNNQFGFIDETGKVVVKPLYDLVGEFQFGACMVVQREKFGLISSEGNEILPTEHQYIGIIGQNRISMRGEGLTAMADFNGKCITGFEYGGIFDFSEGLAAAYKGLQFGYLNEEGKEVIPFQLEFAEPFRTGYALVKQQGKFGLINKQGHFEKKPVYDFCYSYENCYVVNIGGTIYDDHVSGGKFGILSKDNVELTKPSFDFIGPFDKSGITIVIQGELYGSINDKGEITVPIHFKEPVKTKEIFQRIMENKKTGLKKNTGEIIIPPIYEDLVVYPESLLCWARQNGLYGILNFENDFIIPPSFEMNTLYPIRRDQVHIELSSGKHGLLSISSGNWILPPVYDSVGVFKGSLVELKKDGRIGYANREGKIVWME